MDTKLKAKELVRIYDEQLNRLACGTSGIEEYIYNQAKQCALIAVDEILNTGCVEVPYWFKVKQEIEKL